jgi:prophage DNA circulation protein
LAYLLLFRLFEITEWLFPSLISLQKESLQWQQINKAIRAVLAASKAAVRGNKAASKASNKVLEVPPEDRVNREVDKAVKVEIEAEDRVNSCLYQYQGLLDLASDSPC